MTGHYESAREQDANAERFKRQDAAQRLSTGLHVMKNDLPLIKVPPRFTSALEDFHNWLKVTYPHTK